MNLFPWLWAHWWPRLWPALAGGGASQVITYFKLKARIEAHHLAQDIRARRLAGETRAHADQLAAELAAGHRKLADDLAVLAETIRSVMRHREDSPLCVAVTLPGVCARARNASSRKR